MGHRNEPPVCCSGQSCRAPLRNGWLGSAWSPPSLGTSTVPGRHLFFGPTLNLGLKQNRARRKLLQKLPSSPKGSTSELKGLVQWLISHSPAQAPPHFPKALPCAWRDSWSPVSQRRASRLEHR